MKTILISDALHEYIAQLMEILNIDNEEEIIWNLIATCDVSKKDIYSEGYQ